MGLVGTSSAPAFMPFKDMGMSGKPIIKMMGVRTLMRVRYFGGTQEFLSEDQRAL
jgi:hypothetical protein